jgi:mRNA-degrading endonuclease toxin of MazEF toxin-antitoxin module
LRCELLFQDQRVFSVVVVICKKKKKIEFNVVLSRGGVNYHPLVTVSICLGQCKNGLYSMWY